MKSFTKTHIYFAVFFIVAMIIAFQLPPLIRELRASPDASQYYLRILIIELIFFGLTYGATISWLLFAIYHLFVITKQKDKH